MEELLTLKEFLPYTQALNRASLEANEGNTIQSLSICLKIQSGVEA